MSDASVLMAHSIAGVARPSLWDRQGIRFRCTGLACSFRGLL